MYVVTLFLIENDVSLITKVSGIRLSRTKHIARGIMCTVQDITGRELFKFVKFEV